MALLKDSQRQSYQSVKGLAFLKQWLESGQSLPLPKDILFLASLWTLLPVLSICLIFVVLGWLMLADPALDSYLRGTTIAALVVFGLGMGILSLFFLFSRKLCYLRVSEEGLAYRVGFKAGAYSWAEISGIGVMEMFGFGSRTLCLWILEEQPPKRTPLQAFLERIFMPDHQGCQLVVLSYFLKLRSPLVEVLVDLLRAYQKFYGERIP